MILFGFSMATIEQNLLEIEVKDDSEGVGNLFGQVNTVLNVSEEFTANFFTVGCVVSLGKLFLKFYMIINSLF